jgi:eukaryotic-like serine/threonine-protein kinase
LRLGQLSSTLEPLIEVRDLSGEYTVQSLGTMSTALLGTVTAAFKLPLASTQEEVSSAAYPYYSRGIFFNRRDNRSSDEAIPLFEKAIELDERSTLPGTGLAEAYLIKYRATREVQWLDRAREALAAAESRNPDSAMVHFENGGLSREAGWPDKAIDSYRRAIDLEPWNGEFWSHLGTAYESMNGRQADAVQAFQKALDLQPGYFAPHLELGIFWYRQGDYAEAENQFRQVIELAPESEAGHYDLCAIYVVTARYEEAESACRRAMELYPSAIAYNNLGVSLVYQGRDSEALAQYRQAITLAPQSYESYQNAGDACRRLNLVAEAASLYRKGRDVSDRVLRDRPSDGYPRSFVAYFAARLGERRAAENDIAQALKLASDGDTRVLRMAALTYEALHKRNEALALLRTAPQTILSELDRHPDLGDLRRDQRFRELITDVPVK